MNFSWWKKGFLCLLKMPVVFSDTGASGLPEEEDTVLYPGSSIIILAIWISVWCPSSASRELLLSFSSSCSASYCLREQICHRPSVLFHSGFWLLENRWEKRISPPSSSSPLVSWVQMHFAVWMLSEGGHDSKEIGYSGWTRESPCVVKISRWRHIVAFKSCIGKWKL